MVTDFSSLPAAQIAQLRVLALVSEAVESSGNDLTYALLHERVELETDLSGYSVKGQLRLLKADGLVILDERYNGAIAGVRLSTSGQMRAGEFNEWRNSLHARRRQLRDDYLNWLYEQIEEHETHPTPDDFLKLGHTFAGIPFTGTDLEKTGEWLAKNGFIDGQAAWQYKGPLFPTLTAKGSFTVENQRSTNDAPPSMGHTFNTTVNGSANLAQASTNVHQHLSVEWKFEGLRLADTIGQALPSLGDVSEVVREQLAIARTELTGAADVSRVKTIFGSIADFLGQTAAGTLGGVLATMTTAYLATLQ